MWGAAKCVPSRGGMGSSLDSAGLNLALCLVGCGAVVGGGGGSNMCSWSLDSPGSQSQDGQSIANGNQ